MAGWKPAPRLPSARSAVRRGVPRSPNHHLDELGTVRQVELGWRQIKTDSFPDIPAGFRLRVTGGCAARQFRTHCRVTLRSGIVFENDAKLHFFVAEGIQDAPGVLCRMKWRASATPQPRTMAAGRKYRSAGIWAPPTGVLPAQTKWPMLFSSGSPMIGQPSIHFTGTKLAQRPSQSPVPWWVCSVWRGH